MTYVKICGITNLPDARAAAEAGADLLGFIFYPPSPRYVAPECAKEIIRSVRADYGIRTVGVFVDASLERMREVMAQCGLDVAQLHGGETTQTVRALAPRAFKSLRPRDPPQLWELVETYRGAVERSDPAFIVDAFHARLFGGTGERADWDLARQVACEWPILLAGGLTAENVAEAIDTVRPWGIDVSSGVERAPGLKDHEKVRRFVARAKGFPGRNERG
jgi:phosphoribosylanthranilate isomerase